jgi:hypothetical protein
MSNTRLIPLSRGQHAIVDAADYDELSRYRWHAVQQGRDTYRAIRSEKLPDGSWTAVSMHRQLLGFPAESVDHVNRQPLDNRRKNLRLADSATQNSNRRPWGRASRWKGVTRDRNSVKYRARISLNGKETHLGVFDTAEEAAAAYNRAAVANCLPTPLNAVPQLTH